MGIEACEGTGGCGVILMMGSLSTMSVVVVVISFHYTFRDR